MRIAVSSLSHSTGERGRRRKEERGRVIIRYIDIRAGEWYCVLTVVDRSCIRVLFINMLSNGSVVG